MRYKFLGYVLWKVGNRFLRPHYEILGFIVWNGGKWYLRHRYGDKTRKIAAGAVVGVALATGVAMAARQVRSGSS